MPETIRLSEDALSLIRRRMSGQRVEVTSVRGEGLPQMLGLAFREAAKHFSYEGK